MLLISLVLINVSPARVSGKAVLKKADYKAGFHGDEIIHWH